MEPVQWNFLGRVSMRACTYLLLFSVSVSGCQKKEIPQPKSMPLAVRVSQVRKGRVRETLSYVGTMHSREEIMILARTAGKIAALPVPEGGQAKAGTVLARIAAPEVRARVSKLRAEAARVRVESAFLCSLAKTDRQLLKAKAVSRVKFQASRQKCASSKAALRAIQASLREVKLVKRHDRETAPFDGTVLQWIAKPGENIMPGRPILMFGGRDMEVRVMVQEKDLARGIRKGSAVVLMQGTDREVLAKVAVVGARAVGPGRMVEVRIPVTQDQVERLGVSHGMSVNVDFVLRQEDDALLVPAAAIQTDGQRARVFRVEGDRARALSVSPGIRQGDLVAVAAKGLEPGDLVITSTLDRIRDGLLVYPVRADGGPAVKSTDGSPSGQADGSAPPAPTKIERDTGGATKAARSRRATKTGDQDGQSRRATKTGDQDGQPATNATRPGRASNAADQGPRSGGTKK